MSLRRLLAALLALGALIPLALVACGSDDSPTAGCTISAAAYDQTCTTDADCIGVPDGNLCVASCTNCTTAAVNQDTYAQYSSDLANLEIDRRDCPCALVPVKCLEGTCRVVKGAPSNGGS